MGANWKEIIEENTKRISDRLYEEIALVFDRKERKRKSWINDTSWRFELLINFKADCQERWKFDKRIVYEVYAGKNCGRKET